jgi:catechol 2,3-dioxygenase
MPVPTHVFNPPFTIVRASHAVLTVADLARARTFYEELIGLQVEDADASTVYLRGVEERQHHSLVLKLARGDSGCERIGLKVASAEDLEKAAFYFRQLGLPAAFVETPYQGRTLHVTDPLGVPLELVHTIDRRPNLLQQYARYRGVKPQRLDHFNIFSPDVQRSLDFYAGLGFRLTEYAEEDGPDGRIAAGWMHRKGNVHDIAFTNGIGPRLHHICYWTPSALDIIHLCDLLATTGHVSNLERGPGRHGISNAFFLYVRDPDGHRIELYNSDYQTMDPDHEPIRWSLRDPRRQTLWGAPAPKSWFEEGTSFPGQALRDPSFVANVIIAS